MILYITRITSFLNQSHCFTHNSIVLYGYSDENAIIQSSGTEPIINTLTSLLLTDSKYLNKNMKLFY